MLEQTEATTAPKFTVYVAATSGLEFTVAAISGPEFTGAAQMIQIPLAMFQNNNFVWMNAHYIERNTGSSTCQNRQKVPIQKLS